MSHEHLFGSVGDDQYLLYGICVLHLPVNLYSLWLLTPWRCVCKELNFKSREGSPIPGVEPYIPFNINPAGMQPVLTTTYLLAFSSIIASIVGSPFLLHVKEILNPESTVGAPLWVYYSVYAFLCFSSTSLTLCFGDGVPKTFTMIKDVIKEDQIFFHSPWSFPHCSFFFFL